MALTKEQAAELRGNKKPETKTVPVPEFGGEVIVRGIPLSERVALSRELGVEDGQPLPPMFWAAFNVRCCIDEAGERLWADSDATWLDKFPQTVGEIYKAARYLSGLDPDAVEAAKKD